MSYHNVYYVSHILSSSSGNSEGIIDQIRDTSICVGCLEHLMAIYDVIDMHFLIHCVFCLMDVSN